jgi:serine/threonine protein kinase
LSAHFSATAYIPLAPGQLLQNDSIKIIKQLNIGGWSAIYLVQEANTRLRVLKEAALPQDARSEMRDKAIAMFSREAQFLMKLDHPHIVKVYNYFEEAGRQYLLIDFVSGTNLRQLVKTNGALHKLDILDYAIRICDVLDYMHGLKPPMVHRDITPENLVVSSDGELKLIDFGAANELLGTATGTMVGKQSYMPIEQFRGKAVTQSDLFYLSTGQDPEPLQSCNPRDSGAQIDEGLNQLIIALTSQNPGDRPQSALDVKTRLIALRR